MSKILIGMDASPEELLAGWAVMRLTISEAASHQGRGGFLPTHVLGVFLPVDRN